ncbi:MAG: 50S ribosomal protein L24 [Alphaproteobacteria bacterium]|nr:50S ribosomal protein L24 [Alphaproteobacteria bacterium]
MTQAKMKIRKGDQVIVLTGKDKGAKGEVLKAIPSESRVVVQGVNVVTRHKKPTQFSAGGIEKIEKAIHVSNVALVDPKEATATRVGYKILKDGKKARVAKKSGETIG